MKNGFLTIAVMSALGVGTLVSCNKDLNRQPYNTTTASEVFSTPAGAKEALAKVYGAYALTGSSGSASSDLGGIDAGTSDFVRLLWDADELSTDEAVCAWNDPGVPDFHNMSWNSSNVILLGLYARSIYQITVANAFIQQASAVKGKFTGSDATDLANYVAEARFLRAFQYSELMDLFANPPFVTDQDPIGSYIPKQISRSDLFAYVESELKNLDSTNAMVAAGHNEYGRADQGCVWALLARVYLNAAVYTGTARYTDAITYSSKVINSGVYKLMTKYANLFESDNNLNNTEQLLSISYDGINTQNYGGTTFIINAAIGGSMVPANYGVPGGGWGGNRVTSNIPNLFPDLTGTADKRSMFYTSGQTEAIAAIGTFTNGLAVTKFTNLTSTGATPAGASVYASTSFPLFRLAEQYLIYAEAVLRGGTGGTAAQALADVNTVRERAYGGVSGDLTSLTLQNILDERGRELYWECFRRTDLIRYGLFTTGSYLWPWKGGVSSGTGVDAHYNIFPIPATDLNANGNLTQNPGY
ncbi:RagB/SusD family nutrient uptake outer membrane protein [Dinghuibacter silviterrae]|uniref:Putative outer membrane starch-binding protein n=1 Tax=Dinghuibacter silviterrae TaxID=1539049 RepID=A0A4V3GLL0_9BACT|nr:RagB/SusD family nutrient uptake outer membrane protein [Dinghuibacter silviterrae]TDW99962.1 putative outer membrane starch-binding protein [Dinghuibacter silviterrae]